MYINEKMQKIIALIAFLVVAAAVVLFIFKDDDITEKDDFSVPTPNQIVYGVNYKTELECDSSTIATNILSEPRFSDYDLKKEYCMIYQIRDEENEEDIKDYLGIEAELPEVDYTEKYLLLSVGKTLEDVSDNSKMTDSDGVTVLDLTYGETYTKDKVYIYLMNTVKVLSGNELETFYWESGLSQTNLVERAEEIRSILSEGKYHKLYLNSNDMYEYVLYSNDGVTVKKRVLSEFKPEITEISETMVKIDFEEYNHYYNPANNIFSPNYSVKTGYLIYNIITFMQESGGTIQLILVDAYDKTLYGKIVRLPFTYDPDNMDSLVKSIEVVDDTHISVEYYTGDDRQLVKETVTVYNLYR